MSTAKRMRKLVDKHRQIEVARVESAGSNRWDLRVEGRPYAYDGVGGTWLDSDNAEGEDVAIAFGFGNPLLPIMFSRGSRPLAAFVPIAAAPIALTLSWLCTYAHYDRDNSWTNLEAPFDYATAVAGDEGVTYPFRRYSGEFEVLSTTSTTEIYSATGNTTIEWEFVLFPPDPETEEVAGTVSFWEILSQSLYDDTCYTLIRFDADDGETYTTYCLFAHRMFVEFGLTKVEETWRAEVARDDGTIFAFIQSGEADITVTGGRVCLLLGDNPGIVTVSHWDQALGGDRQDYTYNPGTPPNDWQILTDDRRNDWRLLTSGSTLIVMAERNVFALSLETNEPIWESLTTAPGYSLVPQRVFDTTVLCGFEKTTYTLVQDLPLTVDRWEPVLQEIAPRTELAEGLSLEAGQLALVLSTGLIINETTFAGEEPNEQVAGPYEDYVVDLTPYQYTILDKVDYSGTELPEYHFNTGFSKALHPRFHQAFQFPRSYIADTNNSDPETEDWRNLFGDYDPEKEPLLDEFDQKTYNAWEEQVRAELEYGGTYIAPDSLSTYPDNTANEIAWLTSLRTYLNGEWLDKQISIGAQVEDSRAHPDDIISADLLLIQDMDVRLTATTDADGATETLNLLDIRVSNLLHGDESFTEPTLVTQPVRAELPDPRSEANDSSADAWVGNSIGFLGFVEWWATRGEDPDPYDGLEDIAWMLPTGGSPYDILRRIIWRGHQTLYDTSKTTKPGVRCGPGGGSASIHVLGPAGSAIEGVPLVWQGWRKNATLAWTDTYSGSATSSIVATPILIGQLVLTFALVDSTPTLFVHRITDGTRLGVLTDGIPEMAAVVFNGTTIFDTASSATFEPA